MENESMFEMNWEEIKEKEVPPLEDMIEIINFEDNVGTKCIFYVLHNADDQSRGTIYQKNEAYMFHGWWIGVPKRTET